MYCFASLWGVISSNQPTRNELDTPSYSIVVLTLMYIKVYNGFLHMYQHERTELVLDPYFPQLANSIGKAGAVIGMQPGRQPSKEGYI